MKPADVRFYFDEDVLGLAGTVARLREDCTFVGDPGAVIHKRIRPPSPIARGVKDDVWLPRVTELGWLVISRDYQIRETPAERRAVREAGARMVILSGDEAKTVWGQLELLMLRWRRIEGLLDEPGPFIYQATRSRFRELSLEH